MRIAVQRLAEFKRESTELRHAPDNVHFVTIFAAYAIRPDMPTSYLRVIILAAIIAGTVSTAAQLLLWWLTSVPLPDVLYRDTRLAAAMVLSHSIITLDQLFQPPSLVIWLAASIIHFALSLLYAAIFVWLAPRLRLAGIWLLPAGIAFGLIIYGINMYGVTFVMPWFTLVRDWITIAAHAVFGLSLALVVRANTRSNAPLLPF